jgi:hypothetical protein
MTTTVSDEFIHFVSDLLIKSRADGMITPDKPIKARVILDKYHRLSNTILADGHVRSAVHTLRQKLLIASDCNGYFLAHNASEMTETMQHLQSRIDAQTEVVTWLKRQMYQRSPEEQPTT